MSSHVLKIFYQAGLSQFVADIYEDDPNAFSLNS